MKVVLNRFALLFLSISSGIPASLAFPNPSIYPFAFLSIAILFYVLLRTKPVFSGICAFAFFFSLFLMIFRFAFDAAGLVPYLVLSFAEALFYFFFGFMFSLFKNLWARPLWIGQNQRLRQKTVQKKTVRQKTVQERVKNANAVRGIAQRINARPTLFLSVLFTLLLVSVEEVRALFPYGGLPIGRFGMIDAPTSLTNLAFLGGEQAVSIAVVFISCLLLLCVYCFVPAQTAGRISASKYTNSRQGAGNVLPYLVLIAAVFFGGFLLPVGANYKESNKQISFGAVQGNVKDASKGRNANMQEVFSNHVKETKNLFANNSPEKAENNVALDVVFWPENSLEMDPYKNPSVKKTLDDLTKQYKTPIMIGTQQYLSPSKQESESGWAKLEQKVMLGGKTLDKVSLPNTTQDSAPQDDASQGGTPQDNTTQDKTLQDSAQDNAPQDNAVRGGAQTGKSSASKTYRLNEYILWEGENDTKQTYFKRHVLPFGEYVPNRSFFESLSSQVEEVGDDMIAPTKDIPGIFTLRSKAGGHEIKVGALICFEIYDDDLVFETAAQGAEFIVEPTNNASFGFSSESNQQLQAAKLDSISTGRAVLQISTVGISALITPDGKVSHKTDLFQSAEFAASANLAAKATPAMRIHDMERQAIWAISGLMLLVCLLRFWRFLMTRRL
jgi:apolipoprotein N-acyltransferase